LASEKEIAPGTASGRWKVLLVTLGIAIPLVLPYQYDYITGVADSFRNAEELIAMQTHRALWSIFGTGVADIAVVYAAYAIFRFARDILAVDRCPPRGSRMPFAVRVVTGRRARFQARTYQVTAVLLVTAALLLFGFAIWSYVQLKAMAVLAAQAA